MTMKTITERREVRSAVSAYWEPPFLGTLTIWVIDQRTKSIQDIAAAKEKPATMELRVWVWSSWETRFTVWIAADMVLYITLGKKLFERKFLFFNQFFELLTFDLF